jgi:glycosyltransferase involved in cell wall biosynthesis
MNFLDDITVLILSYNEEANIGRTLDALSLFPEIVVLDSGSTDATLSVVARYPNVRCVTRPFDTHERQWNYGLTSCGIERPWVLALDADYLVSAELVKEIAALSPTDDVAGYHAAFRYRIFGRALRATLYPPIAVLYRRCLAKYVQDGHTQRVVIVGSVKNLRCHVDHDDRKPLTRWLSAQQRYAALEADYLLATPRILLGRNDRIRLRGWPAPILVFLYALVVKGCLFDGWPGWYYVMQRTFAEIILSLELIERRLQSRASTDRSSSKAL